MIWEKEERGLANSVATVSRDPGCESMEAVSQQQWEHDRQMLKIICLEN